MFTIFSNEILIFLIISLNIIIASEIAKKMQTGFNGLIIEACAGRRERKSLYLRCIHSVKQAMEEYEKSGRKQSLYIKVKEKMKKSGYRSEYSALWYLLAKYVVPIMLFIISLITNFPNVRRSIFIGISAYAIVEIVVSTRKKELRLKFQRYIYKIYKYLHNQISSGVKVTDAIRSVYEIVDDKKIKQIMMQMAASYELSLDIDKALEEFRSNFDQHEAQTLCVALKQGVLTGDNSEILARQEDIMFKKYFNYIQAETESCRTRCVVAVGMFMSVVVIMILVPLFRDASEALNNIFIR